jgi:hypothetical protein
VMNRLDRTSDPTGHGGKRDGNLRPGSDPLQYCLTDVNNSGI